MDLDPGRLRTRVDRVLAEVLEPAVCARSVPLQVSAWTAPGEPVPFAEARAADYAPFSPGDAWGRPWGTTWFRMQGEVPDGWDDIEAVIDLGFTPPWPGFQAEGLAYDARGRILKGIAPLNQHVRLPAERTVELFVEAASNPDILRHETFSPTPLGVPRTAGDEPLYVFRSAQLTAPDRAVQELVDDVRLLRGLLDVAPTGRPRRARVARALAEMLTALDPFDVPGTAAAARAALRPALSASATATSHEIAAVGHAHIDSAWLWPVRETVRKCARTFSNVLDLMDEDPDVVFACSSAQQYAWIRERYPELHERIAARVAEGRWAVTGGMWVESDTMMPSGEALARQFVEGAAYFRDAFGVECEDVWLPDSFGYSGGMPQIAVAAGARWFLTQKLSWNDTNRMPHHTFTWRGIDGTGILTHFPPSDTYAAQITPHELDLSERQFTEHAWASEALMLFGHGDGGGGPTRRMMAAARRSADIEGLPRVRVTTPRAFFSRTEDEARDGDLAAWTGEIYLELHRGTLTSQARTKHGNRRNEQLLHAAELWATTATVRTGAPYPADELRGAWRTVLLNQFHDILPGSAIGWVHEQAEATHAAVSEQLRGIVAAALEALVGPGDRRMLANASPFEIAGIPAGAVGRAVDPSTSSGTDPRLGAQGRTAAVDQGPHADSSQTPTLREGADSAGDDGSAEDRGTGPHALATGSADHGNVLESAGPASHGNASPAGHGNVLENAELRVAFDAAGTIRSLVARDTGRELVPEGTRFGVLRLHPDRPGRWDAWDIDRSYRDAIEELTDATSIEVIEDGRGAVVRVEREAGASAFVQEWWLDGPRLETRVVAQWQERERLLKLGLPLAVHADRFATETQFGHITRPLAVNTSWDEARYEVCQHRWLHVGDTGFGVAIANDATYGVGVRARDTGGVDVGVSLLRGSRFPDPDQDRGRHEFRFTIAAPASIRDAVALGYRLGMPVVPVTGGAEVPPLVTVESGAIMLETVKLAEDGSGDVVVRLYEALGGAASATLRTSFDWTDAVVTDLHERPVHEDSPVQRGVRVRADAAARTVALDDRAFGLVTLRFCR